MVDASIHARAVLQCLVLACGAAAAMSHLPAVAVGLAGSIHLVLGLQHQGYRLGASAQGLAIPLETAALCVTSDLERQGIFAHGVVAASTYLTILAGKAVTSLMCRLVWFRTILATTVESAEPRSRARTGKTQTVLAASVIALWEATRAPHVIFQALASLAMCAPVVGTYIVVLVFVGAHQVLHLLALLEVVVNASDIEVNFAKSVSV